MTPVSIGELNTEVTAQPSPQASARPAPREWDELERLRDTARELRRLHERTHAEGFDA